ncbi:unnamed protein product [Scytosiphon promiscuus]
MSLSPYIQPLPYGRWALSFVALMGAFFWVRSAENWGECGEQSRRSGSHGEEDGEEEEEEEAKHSSAYQTDQEVDRAYQRATGRIPNRRRSLFAAMRPTASSGFPAAEAAAAAASAVRRSHLDFVVDQADRCRLEREAFRARVHEHVGRELARETTQAAAALASNTGPEGMGIGAGRGSGGGGGGP